ncbi:MAG TPA: uroporphyrinogen decarboxylase [Candidatus Dormibacteraeota bacterium]|nr:uroporphyrinogen decarboxylase [Candidatus Dormibacteraeota bacterium]
MTQIENDNFLRACWRKETDFTPVWFMRQAGRYLESYRKVRAENDVLTICKTPELSAKVTVAAVDELGVDAAILFADIMLPLDALGVKLELVDGVGPVIQNPVTGMEDVGRFEEFSPKDQVPYVMESIGAVKQTLDEHVPLIGFSGAPFTLASYLIEGSPSREFLKTKKMMYSHLDVWNALMSRLARIVSSYLQAQISAGVDAVQLFDSWSGSLAPADYQEFVLPYNKEILETLSSTRVPRIHFGVGTAGILKTMKEAGGDVIGVDWRVPIDEAWTNVGNVAIQGNLDPATLLGQWNVVESRTEEILSRIGGRSGHIFNLGHGVLPETPVDMAKRLVQFVHKSTQHRSQESSTAWNS